MEYMMINGTVWTLDKYNKRLYGVWTVDIMLLVVCSFMASVLPAYVLVYIYLNIDHDILFDLASTIFISRGDLDAFEGEIWQDLDIIHKGKR